MTLSLGRQKLQLCPSTPYAGRFRFGIRRRGDMIAMNSHARRVCVSAGPSNEDLLARYRAADFSSFDAFYRRNESLILNFLRLRLRNRPDADDAFQETFLRLHRSIASYRPGERALPWVLTIAHNVAVDMLRQRGRRSQDTDESRLTERATAEIEFDARRELAAIRGQMTSDEWRLIEARLSDEESFEDLARDLATTPTNVRQRLSRLLRRIRTESPQ